MGWLRRVSRGISGFADTMLRPASAKSPSTDCPEGYMIDVATGGNVCIGDLVIDVKTGELISPAEQARRESGVIVWDSVAEVWVTAVELRERGRTRTREEREERRRTGQEVFDRDSGEWMTPREQRRRARESAKLRQMLFAAGIQPEALPVLSRLRAGIIRETGVAEPTEPAEPAVPDADGGALDYLRDLVGPEKREEESKRRKVLVMLAYMAAILAAIVLTRTRSAT